MSKSNYEICNSLYEQYIEDNDLGGISRLITSLPQLVQNNLACCIEAEENIGSPNSMTYRLAAKFIQKYNKKIKCNRRSPLDFEFGDTNTIISEDNSDLVNLTKYILDNGIYFAKLDSMNYCILDTKVDSIRFISNIKLYFIGKNWRKWRKKFMNKLDKYKKNSKLKSPEMITSRTGTSQVIFKSFDNIIMRNKKQILNYIDNWVDCIPLYYNKYKMIPKLSILLYGKPGTGKSTFYQALAKYLNIHRITLIDNDYLSIKNSMRNNTSIYAIDDIDCICQSRKASKDNNNSVVLSALLEFLDNPPTFRYLAKDGVQYPIQIVVATTNYYNKLDPAVKRYGRFDLQIEMDEFDRTMAQKMCDMYDLKLDKLVNNSDKKDFKISPAKLQAICLNNIDCKIKQKIDRENGFIKLHRRTYY